MRVRSLRREAPQPVRAERSSHFAASGDAPTLAAAIDAFQATLAARTPRTAATYRSALNRFVEFLRDRGHDPATLTTELLPATILEDFFTWQFSVLRAAPHQRRVGAAADRAHRRSAANYVAGARAFLRFLDRRSWLAPGVSYERMKEAARAVIGRTPYPTPQVRDEVAAVVSYVNSLALPPAEPRHLAARLTLLRDRAMLLTLYATALRRSELAALSRAEVQDGRAAEVLVSGKGEKPRAVFFDQDSLDAIRAYLQERGDTYAPLFIRHDRGRGKPGPGGERLRLSPQTIWKAVKHYGQLAGVEVTTHHLRHLRARVLLNNGLPLEALQDVLGHASPATTKMIYAPLSRGRLRALVEASSLSAAEVARRTRISDTAQSVQEEPGKLL
jgi:site-specific recombinase XerD